MSPYVECMWTVEGGRVAATQRVLPDGCMDLLATPDGVVAVVGTMTRFEDVALEPGAVVRGVRFRPGMLYSVLPVPAWEITDGQMPLRDLARRLREPQPPDPVQRALAWLTARHGQSDLDWLASQAGVSVRQFRRLCRDRVGISPKHLARILRFRRASALGARGDWAGVAAECGYYDQAHLIRDFHEFSGRTPGVSVFSNQAGERVRYSEQCYEDDAAAVHECDRALAAVLGGALGI
jgi:AraC-like DNA-binding protein